MTRIALAVVLSVSLATPVRTGFAARYRAGMMEEVSRNRGLPIVRCMVASPYHPIGAWVTVSSQYGSRRCRVTDVPQPKHRPSIIRRGIVIELDHNSARHLCNSVRNPPRLCPVTVKG